MNTIAKQHHYALRIPAEDTPALTEAQKQTGQSINQLIVLCVRKALPDIVATFAASKRVTNVQPLGAAEWRRIYARPDELEQVTAKKLSAFQVQEEPE